MVPFRPVVADRRNGAANRQQIEASNSRFKQSSREVQPGSDFAAFWRLRLLGLTGLLGVRVRIPASSRRKPTEVPTAERRFKAIVTSPAP